MMVLFAFCPVVIFVSPMTYGRSIMNVENKYAVFAFYVLSGQNEKYGT